ncbi:hypothetical protein Bca101_071476 [Brassica carinata]
MSTPWSYWWTQDFGSVATEMDLREPGSVWHSLFRSVSLVFTSALCRCFSGEALWTYHRFSVLARGGFLGSPWGLRCSGFPLELRVKIRLPSIIVGSLEPP